MSLTPVIYVDNETVIGATNLNAIQDAILANEQGLANKVNTSDYNPSAKTSEMTQEVGKDSNGKLWTNPSGGAGLVIKGYYATLEALQQAVPNPSLGDTYGVGSQAPYEIYMWSGSTWVDNGTIKGEDGYSPAVTISQTATGHDVTITDKTHPSGQTFSVDDGEQGDDGFSPVVSSAPITGGTRVSIQDATHTETFDVLNGTGSGDMQVSVYDPQSAVATAGGIPEYVNENGGKIDHIQLNGTEQAITNKTVNLTPYATDVAYGESNVGAELESHSSQIVLLNTTVSGHTTDILNLQRRTKNNITSNLANLPTAIAQQNLEKYGYAIGDYFVGSSGYTYWLADMDTYYGGYNSYAVVSTHHCAVVVDTKSSSQWDSSSTAPRYDASVLHAYLSGTVLNNVKSDLNALFGSWSSHIISHEMLANGIGTWGWSGANYIRAMTELEVCGSRVWSADGYQQGEAVKQLELFRKFRFNEIFGNTWFWLRSLYSSSGACRANDDGSAIFDGVTHSARASGLILLY